MNVSYIKQLVDECYSRVLTIRRQIHQNPELAQEEQHTASLVAEILDELNIEHHFSAGYGIVATIYGGKANSNSPTVGIRCDMDALPLQEKTNLPFTSQWQGKMHACGHDIHTAMLLGTALVFSKIKDQLNGNIRFLFQPSEETIGGARQMIEEGATKNPDLSAIIGLHVAPDIQSGQIQLIEGTMNAASTVFTIKVKGKSCHGAHPEKGADSIVCASSIVLGLQTIVTRNLPAPEPAIITVGAIHGGTKGNIIAGETTLTGIIRVLDSKVQKLIKDRVLSLCTNVGNGFDCDCEVIFKDSYPALHNDPKILDIIENAAKETLGNENVIRSSTPSMGADDFSYFCYQAPSLYFNLGCAHVDEGKNYPLHSEYFNPDENCMKTGMLMELLGSLRIIENYCNK